ncbi:MAG: ATP-binding protein [Planctomycetaceae bacterium]
MSDRSPESLEQEVARLEGVVAEMHQQLLQAQKLGSIGMLASSITHEFNNILTTVINYAKMGVRHRDEAVRDKAFDKILTAGQRASKITTGLLSYARARGDRRDVHSLAQLVQDVLILVEKDLQKHRISTQLDLQPDALAEVNSSQIQQVLLNLIINARQAMEPGGMLCIATRRNEPAGTAELLVRDSGSGIPADKLPLIFEPFYTSKTADAGGQGGTGLGLALCKDVVESHRGRIRVESVVGKGTTFTLKFPLATAAAAAIRLTIEPPSQKAG